MSDIDVFTVYGSEYFSVSISAGAIPEADYNNPIRTWDSQEKIDKCLCCSRSDCCNCIGERKSRKRSPKKRVDDTILIQLVTDGLILSAKDVSDYFGVPERTAYLHLSKVERMC